MLLSEFRNNRMSEGVIQGWSGGVGREGRAELQGQRGEQQRERPGETRTRTRTQGPEGEKMDSWEGPGLEAESATRAGLSAQARGASSPALTPPPRSVGANSPGAREAGSLESGPTDGTAPRGGAAGPPGAAGGRIPLRPPTPAPGPGRPPGAGCWRGAGRALDRGGGAGRALSTVPGSLTACSRRRRCRRSPGRGRIRPPRGQRSRPCLHCRRGRPTWGGRAARFAGEGAAPPDAAGPGEGARAGGEVGGGRARRAAVCSGGGGARLYQSGRAPSFLKAPASAERRACPRRGREGKCSRGWPRPNPSEIHPPPPLPSPRRKVPDAAPGLGVGGGGCWLDEGTAFPGMQNAFFHSPTTGSRWNGL